mmetsp:Transcript_12151/g.41265  ORF Transcript_12151/g.41265 Transcript_12151/m.41265 type:complete len:700 (+) Transcript_12151:36-2135(+)
MRPLVVSAVLLAFLGVASAVPAHLHMDALKEESKSKAESAKQKASELLGSKKGEPADDAQEVGAVEGFDTKAGEEEESDDEELEVVTLKWGIVVGLLCLAITFVVSHKLEEMEISYLPEAAVAVITGIVASCIFYLCKPKEANAPGEKFDNIMLGDMQFDFEFFMIWLLPPIIFEAGYNMNRQAFFDNIFPTTLYAFLGTLLSTFVVGGIVWKAGQMGISHPIGGLAALVFGSLISATDPVTVLAVFQALGVKVDLFSMVFGESVMNDAVAIVLARTLLSFKSEPADTEHILLAVGLFCKIFIGSLLIGVAYGLISSLVYKYAGLNHHGEAVFVESVMVVSFAWGAYYTAEALELSGIVAILFCGIVMAKYTRDNLSAEAGVLTARGFKCVALLAETYVFVYLGMAAFAFPIFKHTTWKMVGVAILGCALGRLQIYIFSIFTNVCFRSGPNAKMPKISATYMHVMWFSGLRGGVAFAISAVGYQNMDFPDNNDSLAIMQTTLMIALLTIFLMGGSITDIAKSTGILESSVPRDEEAPKTPKPDSDKLKPNSWLDEVDKNVIRPFFTHAKPGLSKQDIIERYDTEHSRNAASMIQRSWRRNTPKVKEERRARMEQARLKASAVSQAMSTNEFKAAMPKDQLEALFKGNNMTSDQMEMEDKVDALRAKLGGNISSAELRKAIQSAGGDIEMAALQFNGHRK